MPKIIFIEANGQKHEIDADLDVTLMEAARANGISGIDGDCGGVCACATCHVYIEDSGLEQIAPQSEMERDMLELAHDVRPTSRLACQIRISGVADGLVVNLPKHQH